MNASLTPAEFATVLRGGFAWLKINSSVLDRLNVFPVPDGDTGNNMTSTYAAGIEAIGVDENTPPPDSMASLGEAFNTELTGCSRGNSGFILARFFHGFFEIVSAEERIDATIWTNAVANGSFHVNGALFAPTEGTMISILAAVGEACAEYAGDDILGAMRAAVESGTKALFMTPTQLPILARAGVIDSGALGMLCIFRGMLAAMEDTEPQREVEGDYRFEPDPDAGDDEEQKIAYRYCTEAVVRRTGPVDQGLSEWLRSMGDSIALVDEPDLLKIHIHTNEPEAIFQRMGSLGEIEHRKVDDMEAQSRLVSAGSGSGESVSVLAFVPGEGFERIYEDFGVTDCYFYGETLPSPDEICGALENIHSEHIIILPNNSNILPSVMAVQNMVEKDLSIIPTKTVIQGITACYGFSEDEDAAANVESMSEFLDDAIGLFLYKSAQDTKFGDKELKKGDWFISRSDEILGVGPGPSNALEEALSKLDLSDVSDAAAYHGRGLSRKQLEESVAVLRNSLPGAGVEHHYGGQKRSALIVSLE